jgi:hypothetical protein
MWGEPRDRSEAIAVLRRTVELGIEDLIREALQPYPPNLTLAMTLGPAPADLAPVLERLGVDRLEFLVAEPVLWLSAASVRELEDAWRAALTPPSAKPG